MLMVVCIQQHHIHDTISLLVFEQLEENLSRLLCCCYSVMPDMSFLGIDA